uniref:Uncharacterized protein n=1 Tax=Avena sativa TaxID=4498 RepID=A0ACD5Z2A3_AVESA
MIQPIYNYFEGRIEGCRVHDIMLDLLCQLASEENFVTIMDVIKVETPFERKVRRLSIHKVDLRSTRLASSSISQVKSFTIFSHAINQMLPLSRFEVLRVLDLQDCNLEESGNLNLSCVGDLLHLRYLGLRDTKIHKIPTEIGKLLFLQTLDLQGVDGDAKDLPASIIWLRNMMFLYLNGYTYLPSGYRNLMSLRELREVNFTQDNDPEEFRYLTELRVLDILLPSMYPPEKLLILFESLGRLHKIPSLCILSLDKNIGNLVDWVPSSVQLRLLQLEGWYETLPTRISSSSLPHLSHLIISVHQVRLEDIQVLGTLPVLRSVYLRSNYTITTVEERATKRLFILSPDAFSRAIVCSFRNVLFAPYMFPRGAMPMIQELQFGLLVSDILSGGGDWDLCIRNFPSLKSFVIKLHGEEERSKRHSEAMTAVMRVATDHPNHPRAYCF